MATEANRIEAPGKGATEGAIGRATEGVVAMEREPGEEAGPLAPPTEDLAFIRDRAQARSLLDPLRTSILERLAEPGSASGVARALGLPRQRVNYHVRELEREGLLVHVMDRRRGNCLERVVRASARRYVVDPEVVGARPTSSPSSDAPDPFSTEELLLAASRSLREVGRLRDRARETGKRVPTLSLETRIRFASPAEEVEFAHAVHAAFTKLTEHYDRPGEAGARPFRITLSGHPSGEAA